MLEYDNSAFYYFSLTLLVIYLIPGIWFALSEVYQAFAGSGEIGSKARTKTETAKAEKLKQVSTGLARLRKYPFIINLAILAVTIPIFIYLVTLVQNDGQVSTFDPYQVLGIEHTAIASEIKKAYRKLSLKYHPDKNIGNKLAEEMFMKIAKAYEALTDETSKENYEKYGNPDGKQSLEVSIGLPRFILDHPKIVLVLYLIGMVVIIPVVVGLWYANSKQFGEKNIMYETYTAFYQLLLEAHREKNLPEIIAASAECRTLNTMKKGENDWLSALCLKMKTEKLMSKPKYEHPVVLRGNLLLHAHLLRMVESENIPADGRAVLDKMLAKTPELMEGLIEIAYQRKWLETTYASIRFAQYIIQGLWPTASNGNTNHFLMQLPHVTTEDVKLFNKGPKAPKTMTDFLKLSDDDKKGKFARLSDEDRQDVLNACKLFPIYRIEHELFVEEEEKDFDDEEPAEGAATAVADDTNLGKKIFEQDLVTLRVTITRENVKEGEHAPPVYAPLFPKTIQEGLWVILTDKPITSSDPRRPAPEVQIQAVEKITDQGSKIVHELRFMASNRAGQYHMQLHIFSDCYVGLDEMFPIDFEVSPAAELPEYTPHPEDMALDNEPTLFEQVMAANMDEDSSDDEDEEDKSKPSTEKISAAEEQGNDPDEEE